MTKYVKRGECDARKVTDKDGEEVITSSGPVHADHGSYVLTETISGRDGQEDYTVTRVQSPEAFEHEWKSASGGTSGGSSGGDSKRAASKSTPKKSTPKKSTAAKRTVPKKRTTAKR